MVLAVLIFSEGFACALLIGPYARELPFPVGEISRQNPLVLSYWGLRGQYFVNPWVNLPWTVPEN